MESTKEIKLGTYGKLINQALISVSPDLDLRKNGLQTVLTRMIEMRMPEGMTLQSLIDVGVQVPATVKAYADEFKAFAEEYTARQIRIESMLLRLCDEIDRARSVQYEPINPRVLTHAQESITDGRNNHNGNSPHDGQPGTTE